MVSQASRRPQDIGREAEYELAQILWRAGYVAFRLPASGKGHKPDLVAIRYSNGRHEVLLIEVKTRSDLREIRIPEPKCRLMEALARRAGAKLYLAVKVRGWKQWSLIPFDALQAVEAGGKKYRVATRDTIVDWLGGLILLLKRPTPNGG